MSKEDPDRQSFEDMARTLADEVRRALERVSGIDVDELARTASAEADRAGEWFEDLARRWGEGTAWSPGFAGPHDDEPSPGPAADPTVADPLGDGRPSPPHPPTPDPGRARRPARRPRPVAARPADRRPGPRARRARLGALAPRAGDERVRRLRRRPRAARRARPRPGAARPRLDVGRRRDHARRPPRADALARGLGLRLSRATAPAAAS